MPVPSRVLGVHARVRAPWTRSRFCWSPVPKAAAPGSLSPPPRPALAVSSFTGSKHSPGSFTLRLTKGTLAVPEWYPQSGPGPPLQMQIPGGWALFYAKQLLTCAPAQRAWAFAICPLDLLSSLMWPHAENGCPKSHVSSQEQQL